MKVAISKRLCLIGGIAPVAFVLTNNILLKKPVNLVEITMICLISLSTVHIYSHNRDYLNPRVYFPILYFALFWLGDFKFIRYEIVPSYLWWHYLIGLVGYYSGSYLSQRTMKVRYKGLLEKNVINKNSRFLLLIIYLICVGAKIYMFSQNGIPLFASNIDLSRQHLSENYGLLKGIAYGANIIPIFAFYDMVSRKREGGRIPIMDIFVILNSFLIAILDVSRLPIIQMIVCMVIIYVLRVRKPSLKTIVMISFLVLIFIGVNQIIRNLRLDASYLVFVARSRKTNMFQNIMISSFNNFRVGVDDYYKVTRMIPSSVDYTYGKLFFNSLISPFPGKQVTIGYYVADLLGLSFDGVGAATTILGMFYIDGGLVLIFLGMMIFGFFTQYYYKAYIMKNTISIKHLEAIYVLYYTIYTLRTNVLPNIEPIMNVLYYIAFGFIVNRIGDDNRETSI